MGANDYAQLDEVGQVTLDASGNGTVELSPTSSRIAWWVTLAAVSVSSNTREPVCSIYHNSKLLGATYTGSNDQIGPDIMVRNGKLRAVWTGGDAGATAQLSLNGQVQPR